MNIDTSNIFTGDNTLSAAIADTSNIFAGNSTLSTINGNITTYATNYTYTSPMNTSVHYLLSENKIMKISNYITNVNFRIKKDRQRVKETITNNIDIFCYEGIKKIITLDSINKDNFISYDIEFNKFETYIDQNNILTGILTFDIIDKYTNFKLTEMDLTSLNKEHKNLIKKELRSASLKNITKDL